MTKYNCVTCGQLFPPCGLHKHYEHSPRCAKGSIVPWKLPMKSSSIHATKHIPDQSVIYKSINSILDIIHADSESSTSTPNEN